MTDIDWTGCPIVQINPNKLGGTPTVRDLRLSADAIVENFEDNLSETEIAALYSAAH